MAMKKRKTHDKKIKARVALEAVKGEKTIAEIASEYGVHPNQVTQWKKQMLEGLPDLFERKNAPKDNTDDHEKEDLYKEIGKMKVQMDWLKKKLDPFSRD